MDNFDVVLHRLNENEHWQLREALSGSRFLLIGAAVDAPRETYEYKEAFYDFLRVERLRGLDDSEVIETLLLLSQHASTPAVTQLVVNDPGRVRVLRSLSGGNPRAIVMVHALLAEGSRATVMDDVNAMLDMCTPLYKARFESLADQAQRVVDAICIAWDPVTANMLATLTKLDVKAVSSHLNRLSNEGIVERVEYPGKRAAFQIAERLFNTWFLMRAGGKSRQRLVCLVDFLNLFFPSGELADRTPERGIPSDISVDAGAVVWSELSEHLDRSEVLHAFDAWGLWFARFCAQAGEARNAAIYMDERGLTEKYRPIREALMAAAEGPDQLLTIAPEVREPAEKIYTWITDTLPHDDETIPQQRRTAKTKVERKPSATRRTVRKTRK